MRGISGLMTFVSAATIAALAVPVSANDLVDRREQPGARTLASAACHRESVTSGHTASAVGAAAKLEAHYKAIENWRRMTALQLGESYAHWWKAADRHVECLETPVGTYCKARAVPCTGLARNDATERTN